MDVFLGYGGVFGIELECDEATGWRERAGQPDGAVSAEGADLEDICGSLNACDQVEELALVGSDVDRRKASAGVRLYGFVDGFVRVDESADEVLLDCCPEILIHMVMRISVGGRKGQIAGQVRLPTWDVSVFVASSCTRSRDESWFEFWCGFDGCFGFEWGCEGSDGE